MEGEGCLTYCKTFNKALDKFLRNSGNTEHITAEEISVNQVSQNLPPRLSAKEDIKKAAVVGNSKNYIMIIIIFTTTVIIIINITIIAIIIIIIIIITMI